MKLRNTLPFLNRRGEPQRRSGDSLMPIGWYSNTFAGTTVNDTSVLGVAAAWRCINLLADSVARLPLHGWRKGVKLDTTPSLLAKPNAEQTPYETFFSVMTSLVLRGNAYLLPFDYDQLGYPRQVLVLHPDRVGIRREGGEIIYTVVGPDGTSTVLHQSEVLHLKGFVFPGALTGVGVIESQREGIGHAIALQEYGARFYAEGAVPTGIISMEETPLPEEREALAKQWLAMHGARQRTPAVLTGATYQPISFTPEDSQFLQSRQFSLAEVALMFGVPGHFVGAPGSSMTYSNVEQESLNFVQWALAPWLMRIEQAFSTLLPRGTDAKFNIDALLRTDTLARYQAHAIALSNGFLTLDEVRELEGREPLPEEPKPEPPTPPVPTDGAPVDNTTEGDTTNG